jgi:hypothetical protein
MVLAESTKASTTVTAMLLFRFTFSYFVKQQFQLHLYDCQAVNTNPYVVIVKIIVYQLAGAFSNADNSCR